MKEGMTYAFRGGFNEELHARDWRDRFSSMANPEALDRSGIGLLVATLYAHPLMTTSLRGSIRRQLKQAREFVAAHPGWVIARTASEARAALESGKRVLVLALEGASGVLDDEDDLREFVDEGGIRLVTFVHLSDDDLGGVAFLGGIKNMSSPVAFLTQLLFPKHDENGVRINRNGLTPRGRKLAEKLLDHGVWLDLAHASDETQRDLLPILERRKQPLLYTHTVLRRFLGNERGISDLQLEEVRKSRGIVGLIPSPEMLEGTVSGPGTGPSAGSNPSCGQDLRALATQLRIVGDKIGDPARVSLGSDYNGGLPHLGPSCSTGTSLDSEKGLWNIGQVSELWKALGSVGAPVPVPLSKTIEAFLEAWGRI